MGTALLKLPREKELHIASREISPIQILRLFVRLALSRDRVRGEKEGERSGSVEKTETGSSRDQPLILLHHPCTHIL